MANTLEFANSLFLVSFRSLPGERAKHPKSEAYGMTLISLLNLIT